MDPKSTKDLVGTKSGRPQMRARRFAKKQASRARRRWTVTPDDLVKAQGRLISAHA